MEDPSAAAAAVSESYDPAKHTDAGFCTCASARADAPYTQHRERTWEDGRRVRM